MQTGSVIPGREGKDSTCLSASLLACRIAPAFPFFCKEFLVQDAVSPEWETEAFQGLVFVHSGITDSQNQLPQQKRPSIIPRGQAGVQETPPLNCPGRRNRGFY